MTHRLTIVGVHTRFYLRVNPQCRPFFHSTQQERFKVQKHFVVSFTVLGWLVWDNRRKITIPTSSVETKNIHSYNRIILSYIEHRGGRGIWFRTTTVLTGLRVIFFYIYHTLVLFHFLACDY